MLMNVNVGIVSKTSLKGKATFLRCPQSEESLISHPLPPTIPQQLLAPRTTDSNTSSQPPIFVPSTQISESEDYCVEQQPV